MDDRTLLILATLIIIIIWTFYKKLQKPRNLKTFNDFHSKAVELESNKQYDEAIEVRLQALQLEGLSNVQKGDLYYGIGGIYLENKDYQTATEYFDQAFKIVANEKIPYDKRYMEVLDAYIEADRKEDAKKLFNSLLKRQSYNKKFNKLEKFRGWK